MLSMYIGIDNKGSLWWYKGVKSKSIKVFFWLIEFVISIYIILILWNV